MATPTTTIRIPDELKARLAKLAEHEGISTHSLILDAIAEKADAMERRQAFHAEARERHEHYLATGTSIPWEEMRDYLRRRVHGESVAPPVARRRGE
jgi:predicted transcriptional regulator